MLEVDALTHYDSRLFLAQTLAHGQKTGQISPTHLDKIHHDIASLAQKLIAIKVEDLSSRSEVRRQIQEAFTLTSLGLEYGCGGALDKSVRLLNSNRLIRFFQIGNTLVDKLTERSQNTLEKAILIPPATQAVEQEQIPAYNEWESDFLESIIGKKLAIDAAQVSFNQLSANPRSLTSLADINIANQQLDYINLRFNYLQALPQEKIFAADYPPDAESDTSRQITIALMVNLVLYREVDFYLDEEDLDNFCNIAYDIEGCTVKKASQDLLFNWIRSYMEVVGQPEEVKKYAVEYWKYCLSVFRALVS
ncbi:hypothetical protein J4G02_03095 [Candidatus Poribacteria bacterium]|nr:hypothetical protein [Candidatus Poribacteria bacterium]